MVAYLFTIKFYSVTYKLQQRQEEERKDFWAAEQTEDNMDGRLHEAAITGDVGMLHQLLQEDADILYRAMQECDAKDNPLNLGALFGHARFVSEILHRIEPEFARKLSSSPLHVASEMGHVEVVKEILETEHANLCLVRDKGGRIPLHLAAIRGRVGLLEELVKAKPVTAWLRTDEREPILHLCSNHDQFKALKKLVELVPDPRFLTLKDSDDNTILHLLVAKGKPSEVCLYKYIYKYIFI